MSKEAQHVRPADRTSEEGPGQGVDRVRFALCDFNNFFVSCERLLRPDLDGFLERVPMEEVWGIGRRWARGP